MYSLMLMDELVGAVDKLAHENGTSRSNLINRILAEHLSMATPELCISEIFGHAVRITAVRSSLQVQAPQSGAMLVVRSVIRYKYNPAIRYSVELSVGGEACTGEFKVVSRSQSDALLSRLTVFYELWTQIEQTLLPDIPLKYGIAGGRFRRRLIAQPGGQPDSRRVGEAIGRYISLFDDAMNRYFSAQYGVDMETYADMLELYKDYLAETPAVV